MEAASGHPYPMLDRFNRVTSSRWASYKGSGERDFYRVDIEYDHDSNILSAVDHIHKNATGDRNFDVLYAHDDLGRLTRAEEGELVSGSISNRSRDERWLDSSGNLALSQTGAWLHRRLDLDGNGQFNGTDELDETNAFNSVNELIGRDINSNSTPDYEPSYNLAGHQIDDGKDYKYVYDAFGRLMEVRDRGNSDLVAAYRYNGLNFRIGCHSDVTDDSGVRQSDTSNFHYSRLIDRRSLVDCAAWDRVSTLSPPPSPQQSSPSRRRPLSLSSPPRW